MVDFHLWAIAPDKYAAVVSVVAENPESPLTYKARLRAELDLAHGTIEVNRYSDANAG